MSIETINDCVCIPHLPNWTEPPTLKRTWATSIATGIDGSEDRATERTTPVRELSYTVLTDGPEETQLIGERVKDALKSGRSVAPLFGRCQECAHTDTAGVLLCLFNRWTWAVGDYAFLSTIIHDGRNSYRLIDVGGVGGDEWEADEDFTIEHGTISTTASNITAISGMECPPLAVRQTYRWEYSPVGPVTPITIEVQSVPIKPCRVRLWFAFTSDAISPNGVISVWMNNVMSATGNPWQLCGASNYVLGYLDADGVPDDSGVLRIELVSQTASWIQINAISVYSTCWQMLPITGITYIDQTIGGVTRHVISRLTFDPKLITLPGFEVLDGIYPVIFGRLKCDNFTAVTNWNASFPLTITEPLSSAISGRSEDCPVEVCGIEAPTIPDDEAPPEEGSETSGHDYLRATVVGSDLGGNNAVYGLLWGDYGCNKSVFLALFRAVLAKCKSDYVRTHPGATFGTSFWARQPEDTQAVLASGFMGFDGVLYRQWYTELEDVPTDEVCPRIGYGVNNYWGLECEILT